MPLSILQLSITYLLRAVGIFGLLCMIRSERKCTSHNLIFLAPLTVLEEKVKHQSAQHMISTE